MRGSWFWQRAEYTGDDLTRPIEAMIFGAMFALMSVYIAWDFTLGSILEYFMYWSCWNYLVNDAYFMVVLIGRDKATKWRTAALLLTPYMLALNLLWAGLTTVIVLFGSSVTGVGSDDWTLRDIEELIAKTFVHYAPFAVTLGYFAANLKDLRATVVKTYIWYMAKMPLWARAMLMGILLFAPWAFFGIYVLIWNPFTVYGFEKPSNSLMIELEIGMAFGYASIMTVIVVLAYVDLRAKFAEKKALRKAHIKQ
jgi:hypothetical protein